MIFYILFILGLSFGIVDCSSQGQIRETSAATISNIDHGVPLGPVTLQESLRQLEIRVKDMQAELARAGQAIQSRKSEHTKLKKETTSMGRLLATDRKRLQERLVQLEKIENEIKILEALRDQHMIQKLELERKHAEVTQQTREIEIAKVKLEKARDEQAKITAGLESQLGNSTEHLRVNREKTAAIEKEIRQGRQRIQVLEEQVKDSELEVHQTEARLIDGQGRLKEMTLRTSAREADEAKARIDHPQADQGIQRKVASDQPAMSLELRRKVAANSMKTRRDCRIYKKASLKSKVVGSKRAGSVISGQPENNWMALSLPNGTTGFVPMGCFGSQL